MRAIVDSESRVAEVVAAKRRPTRLFSCERLVQLSAPSGSCHDVDRGLRSVVRLSAFAAVRGPVSLIVVFVPCK